MNYPSRALQADYAIGDPFGGPAFGRRDMPVLVIAAAVGSFAAGAAIVGAAGATIGAMIVGGAMMIGGALTIVGTLTGNQNLVKIGGILSLAGGLGAGVLGAMGGLADGAVGAAGAETTAAVGAGDADQALASAQVGGATPPAVAPATPDAGLLSTAPDAAAPAGVQPPALDTSAPATTPAPATPASPDAFTAPAPTAPAAPAPSAFTPSGPNAYSTPGDADQTLANSTVAGGGAGNSGTWWNSALGFAKANPEVARAGLSGASGLLASVVPKPLNALDRAQAARLSSMTAIERMRAGLAPGWWYGKAGG